ncbi:hypothetical protein Tco_0799150 [Tanacetum coccineum]
MGRNFAALINRGLSGKTSGLDKLRLSRAQILWGMFYQKNIDYVELLWEDFIYQIENKVYKKQEKMYYPRFTKAIIHHILIQEKSLSRRNKIRMHTSKDDYLINSLRFVSAKESTQIYGAILPGCLTSPGMKESKTYKTYLGYATCAVPPKMAQKFKKASPSKIDSDLVPVDEEPVQKVKRVKRPAKKSTTKPAAGVIIREAPVETKSKSKEKEKDDVTRGKGIELLSEVALTKEAQMKEVRKKSLRVFYKTHLSGSSMVAEKPPSVDQIIPTGNDDDDNNNDQDSSNEDSEQENESKEQVSDSEQEKESEDDDQEEEEFVHTPSPTDDKDDDNLESKSDDVNKSDEESDDVIKGDKEIIQNIPHTDAEIVSPLDVHVHYEVPRTQAPTLLTIPISVITESSPVYTNIPQSSQTFTPPPILTTPNPSPIIETTNPLSTLLDCASVFQFNDRITALEKEVAKLKKDPLHTQSVTARIKEQVKDQLPQILPKEVSNFAPPVIKALIKESRDEVTLAKVSSQPHSTYEAASILTEFELKKILIDKMEKKPTTGSKKKDSTSGSSKGTKSQPKSSGKFVQSEEPVFEVADSDIPQDQEWNLGDNEDEPRNDTASRRDWFKKPTPPQEPTDPDWYVGDNYPFDLSKPLPLIKRGKHQRVLFEYFINNDLKYLQGGVSTLTYMTSTTKSKASQYDLPGIEDMVPNIWSPVKVSYDRYAIWGISHWREQFTHVKVIRKHGYGYLEEIVVRRADNVLYRFKEALRMFTRSLVIQKRVEDLQLGVESYQKKINVTKPDTTRPDLRKRHPYTPYKDPQGFIYVDDYKMNKLMCFDELYKFSDGTLTRLLSSLKDITKNIDMEYLPKRRWSTLEKKRAHFMIKDINKLLKERRMMRSLEKFIGGRLYGTDLRLMQRTI